MPRGPGQVIVGLTGGLGTGKSTVAKMFQERKAVVLDADQIAHDAMEPRKLAWREVLDRFGEDLVHRKDDVRINRKKLAARVFGDPKALADLEAILHPRVLRLIRQRLHRLARNRRVRLVVLDVPLLLETHMEDLVDAVVVVAATPEVTRRRLHARGMSDEDIARRSAAQWDVSAKAALADHVIDNSKDLQQTRRQVNELWQQLVTTQRKQRA